MTFCLLLYKLNQLRSQIQNKNIKAYEKQYDSYFNSVSIPLAGQ
jgi:hypothetical protein